MPNDSRVISADARAIMLYQSQKKSMGLSYLLWAFLGGLGLHRLYNGRVGSGVAIMLLNIFGLLTVTITVGVPMVLAAWTWVIVDAFLIPGWVKIHNVRLIDAFA